MEAAAPVPTVTIGSEAEVAKALPRVADLVATHGFVVVNAWDTSERALRVVASHMGDVQRHIRANEYGITTGTSKPMPCASGLAASEWQKYTAEYFGVGTEELYPHTDGTFLSGVTLQEPGDGRSEPGSPTSSADQEPTDGGPVMADPEPPLSLAAEGGAAASPPPPPPSAARNGFMGAVYHPLKAVGPQLVEVRPPRMLLLQMAQPAEVGGANIIVDAAEVLTDMLTCHPDAVRTLMRPDVLAVARDNMGTAGFPVFAPMGRGDTRVRLQFRMDAKAYVAGGADVAVALATLQREYLLNPAYQVRVPLEAGQIMVVDNWRALHGREAFGAAAVAVAVSAAAAGGPRRLLRRVWLADDEPRTWTCLQGAPVANRTTKDYAVYGRIRSAVAPGDRVDIPCGIRLPQGLYDKLLSL